MNRINNILKYFFAIFFAIVILTFIQNEIIKRNSLKLYSIGYISTSSGTFTGKLKILYTFKYDDKVYYQIQNSFKDQLKGNLKSSDLSGKYYVVEFYKDKPSLSKIYFNETLNKNRVLDFGKSWQTFQGAFNDK
jgi:hypothetical protein